MGSPGELLGEAGESQEGNLKHLGRGSSPHLQPALQSRSLELRVGGTSSSPSRVFPRQTWQVTSPEIGGRNCRQKEKPWKAFIPAQAQGSPLGDAEWQKYLENVCRKSERSRGFQVGSGRIRG